MNAYNPLASVRRLESAGLPRAQAEAIADEIVIRTDALVTKEQLDLALESSLNKQLVRLGVLIAAIVTLACTILGTVLSIVATR